LTDSSDPLNWTVLLPVGAGGLAIWYLMPGPRRRPLATGALLGVIALAGAGAYLFRGLGEQIPETVAAVLFFGFAGLAIAFAGLMITARNPARSALAFAMVVLSTCGLFLLLAAPFLMAATIIIYAGAIIVTFLFVIMLSQQGGPSNADLRTREPALSAAAGFILLTTLLIGLQRVYDWRSVDAAIEHASRLARAAHLDDDYMSPTVPIGQERPPLTVRGQALVDELREAKNRIRLAAPRGGGEPGLTDHRLVQVVERSTDYGLVESLRGHDPEDVQKNLQAISDGLMRLKAMRTGDVESDDVTLSQNGIVRPIDGGPRKLPAANVEAIGRTLFSDHLLAIELAGALLLVATVGAIAIAARRQEGRQ
jgi:NADH:ubiquinone oxidoreductase subunit 6 (subunit J)